MSPAPALAESLAWLDWCLGEVEAAMKAVKAAARPNPGSNSQEYHAIIEASARIVTLRGRAKKWGAEHE